MIESLRSRVMHLRELGEDAAHHLDGVKYRLQNGPAPDVEKELQALSESLEKLHLDLDRFKVS